ncbi:MAG: hypothetical protein RI929_192 [Actinomycetota bacterium]
MEPQVIIRAWRDELQGIGGTNPLVSFELSSFGQVDLARSHPGGLAQLVSSRSTTLSNLVRDGVAQARAHSTVRRIKLKAARIEENFGISSVFIAGGLVEDKNSGKKLPILLWPTHLISKGDDYEIRIDSRPLLNPALTELITSVRRSFNSNDLLAVSVGQGDLIPLSVLSLVSEILHDANVEVEKLLVLGNFVPDLLTTQLQELPIDQELLLRIAGHGEVSEQDTSQQVVLVANADDSQRQVLRRAIGGNSFAVETLPGCGYLQTAVNLLANLAYHGKRTLVIGPRQQTLDEMAERLGAVGLSGLAIREAQTWTDAVSAISRNEKAQPVALADAIASKQEAEAKIAKYFELVSHPDPELKVSLIDAMRELAALAGNATPATNNSRIRTDLLAGLSDRATPALKAAHQAGVFDFGPQDSPWFAARFESQQELDFALSEVKAISGEEFRTLRYQISRYLRDQKLVQCESVEQWARQLRLLIGIRETLDKFLPSIYDRSLAQMIEATAPRTERGQLSGAQRRRFKKLAKEFIRPGASISNLYISLQQAEQQRIGWLEMNQTQAPPTVPLGLNDVQEKFERITSVLELLQRHLDPNPDIELLTRLNLDALEVKINDLANKTEILDRLLERAPLVAELESMGLGNLVVELCRLHPDMERVENEFQLAWWQSALEAIVNRNPTILQYSATEIAKLEAEFERCSAQLIEHGNNEVKDRLSHRWKSAIAKYPEQADKLRNLLRARELTLKSGYQESGPLWNALASAVLLSPFRLHELSKDEKFDVVIILDAASTAMAESLPAIARASQVIAFGDPTLAMVEDFDTVARANQGHVAPKRQASFDVIAQRFGSLSIRHSYRTEGQVLGRYLNQNFYDDRLILEPAAGQLFGSHNFEHVQIEEGSTATSTIEGATESMDAEVSKVVELVLNHARWTPEQSLCVVTASAVHADRVEHAVSQALKDQAHLAEFFDAHGREKFRVATMSQFTHQLADRVIFSVGFGRTPEGRISGTLGDFNSEFAAHWMVNTIVSARKRLTVVSCYNFEDFAAGKLPENQRWLKDLIAPSFLSDIRSGEPDPLLADLSKRLKKLGFQVALNFGDRIGLAVSLGNRAAVVDADWALKGENWDEKLWLRPGLLRAMGWMYIRVHALEIFAQPQDVANRIAKQLGVDIERKAQPLFEEKAFEDTGRAWGDPDDSNDNRLNDERPPHWG